MPVHTVSTPFIVTGLSMGNESAAAGQANPTAVPIATAASARCQYFIDHSPYAAEMLRLRCGNDVAGLWFRGNACPMCDLCIAEQPFRPRMTNPGMLCGQFGSDSHAAASPDADVGQLLQGAAGCAPAWDS